MTARTAGPAPTSVGSAPRRSVLVEVMTPRRLEILRHVANGHTNAEIGVVLYISVNTVNHHLQDIFGVLGARDRAHAVALGMIRGFVRPSDVRRRPADEYRA